MWSVKFYEKSIKELRWEDDHTVDKKGFERLKDIQLSRMKKNK